jgi:hypothetical protein
MVAIMPPDWIRATVTAMRGKCDRMHRSDKDKSGQRPLFRERDSALTYILTERFDHPLRRRGRRATRARARSVQPAE